MRANKIFFDIYSTPGGNMPYEEYRKWYEQNDTVYICLLDMGIYTKVKRSVMFDMGLNYGCFIEHYPSNTPEQAREKALKFVESENLVYVEPEEFKAIEKQGESKRVQKAFAYAEKLIAEN